MVWCVAVGSPLSEMVGAKTACPIGNHFATKAAILEGLYSTERNGAVLKVIVLLSAIINTSTNETHYHCRGRAQRNCTKEFRLSTLKVHYNSIAFRIDFLKAGGKIRCLTGCSHHAETHHQVCL